MSGCKPSTNGSYPLSSGVESLQPSFSCFCQKMLLSRNWMSKQTSPRTGLNVNGNSKGNAGPKELQTIQPLFKKKNQPCLQKTLYNNLNILVKFDLSR